MSDEEALVPQTAVRHFPENDPERRLKLLSPILYDPVRGVRIEAAGVLTALPLRRLPADIQRQFEKALTEYRHAMERTADFAASSHNLGNLYRNLGQIEKAVTHYEKAVAIDDQFFPAKVNLAMVYNQLGKIDEAEQMALQLQANYPDWPDIQRLLKIIESNKGQ